MRILGVIPARGGSKRIERKNLQSVGGMSLVERAAEHASAAHLLDHWVVSTDILELWTEERFDWIDDSNLLRRPPELAQDDTPMAPVLLHATQATGGNWDAVVTIQPTSPLRTARDIDRCIALLLEDDSAAAKACVSVNAATGERNGAVYVTHMGLIELGIVFGRGDILYSMHPERSLDINTPEDLEEARRILGP